MLFVSFPTLKDTAHDPGPSNRHAAELLVWADWSSVAKYAARGTEALASEWTGFKQGIESRLMDCFAAKFPALAPLVVYRELGTPLATAAFTGHEKGAFYGVETTPRRIFCRMRSALVLRCPACS
jgi:all-trans-retinol 13,14-reductase